MQMKQGQETVSPLGEKWAKESDKAAPHHKKAKEELAKPTAEQKEKVFRTHSHLQSGVVNHFSD